MNPFSILLFVFSGRLLPAGFTVYRGHTGMIRGWDRIKVRDKAAYAKHLGKCIMLCSLVPLAAGLVGLLFPDATVFVLIGGFAAALFLIGRKGMDF